MRTFLTNYLVFAATVCLLTLATANGQDRETPLLTLPAADTGMVPQPTDSPIPLDPFPPVPDDLPPQTPLWNWQHQTQNQQGTVTNLHERTQSPDGNAYSYQHSVTRPSGSHTQLRDYSRTEEGYQLLRQQRFYKPDGTLLREHDMSVTGTDPYNYQRQMTHTFRDGRTMEQTVTRSYDGTTGTMERSFIGPNGQVHQFQRPWTPEDLAGANLPPTDPVSLSAPQEAALPATTPQETASPTRVDPLAPTTTEAEESFWARLNPFKKHASRPVDSTASGNRPGFTVGSFGHSRQMGALPPGQARKASGLSEPSQMRSMKAHAKQIGPPPHAATSPPAKGGKPH